MSENDTPNHPGPAGADARPATAGENSEHRRRRRRPGSHRRRRQHRPAAVTTGAGQPAGVQPSAEAVPPEAAAVPATAIEMDIAEAPPAAAEPYSGPDDDGHDDEAAGMQGTDAAAATSSLSGDLGEHKRRRRRRGGRRHRRRGPQSAAAPVNAAGVIATHPEPADLAVAAESAVPQVLAANPKPDLPAAPARDNAETAVQPKPEAPRRLPAPAPDSAPADALETFADISKLSLRQETDALRVLKFPGLDAGRTKRLLVQFLQEQREKTGLKKAVLGLSGGLDSSVAAALAVEAFGTDHVQLFFFIDGVQSDDAERERAALVASRLRRTLQVLDLRPQLDAFFRGEANVTAPRRRQRAVWEWMAALYDQAAQQTALVITTSNKTKRLLGHSADFGPSGYSVNLLGDVYQSQVRELARTVNVPGPVLEKHSAVPLLQDLGLSLQEADGLLYQIVDVRVSLARLLDLGVDEEKLRRIYRRIKDSAFRRALTPVAEALAAYVPRAWNASGGK
jgi:NAD+ synthase